MRAMIMATAAAVALGACAPTIGQTNGAGRLGGGQLVPEANYQVWDGGEFQSFVRNYDGEQMCAIMTSAADWDRVMAPAAVMNQHRAFAPTADFWNGNAVYLLSRVGAGGSSGAFAVERVQRSRGSIELHVAFTPPAASSSEMKHVVMVVLPKPAADHATFLEGGRPVCTARAR